MKKEIIDYLQLLKVAHYYYSNEDKCDDLVFQIKEVYEKYNKMLHSKRIVRKKVEQLKTYVIGINTFDNLKIFQLGELILDG